MRGQRYREPAALELWIARRRRSWQRRWRWGFFFGLVLAGFYTAVNLFQLITDHFYYFQLNFTRAPLAGWLAYNQQYFSALGWEHSYMIVVSWYLLLALAVIAIADLGRAWVWMPAELIVTASNTEIYLRIKRALGRHSALILTGLSSISLAPAIARIVLSLYLNDASIQDSFWRQRLGSTIIATGYVLEMLGLMLLVGAMQCYLLLKWPRWSVGLHVTVVILALLIRQASIELIDARLFQPWVQSMVAGISDHVVVSDIVNPFHLQVSLMYLAVFSMFPSWLFLRSINTPSRWFPAAWTH